MVFGSRGSGVRCKRVARNREERRSDRTVKMRKGWHVVDADETVWTGDCPRWAASARVLGCTVKPIRIMGRGRWACSACEHNLPH